MLPNLTEKLTVLLALALVGSVGGLGTGLHSVFNCCHHCHSACESSCCHSSFGTKSADYRDNRDCVCSHDVTSQAGSNCGLKAGSAPLAESDSKFAGSDADCAICQLLSHYHSTTVSYPNRVVVRANTGTASIAVPTAVIASSCGLDPCRGPPAALHSAVVAVICS